MGCTSYCEIAKPDNKPIIASAVKASIEKVLSLKPDLVIATSIVKSETLEMLRKFGIQTEVFPTPKSFDEICSQFLRLGELLEKQELADSLINSTKTKVLDIQDQCNWSQAPKLFIQIGAKPLYTVIPNTFMDDYIHFLNGENIAFGLTKGTITREAVIARNPDIILIVTMGIIGNEEKNNWEDFEEISASQNDKVFIIDSNMACTPTPLSFAQTLDTIFELLK